MAGVTTSGSSVGRGIALTSPRYGGRGCAGRPYESTALGSAAPS